jgi:hypothetical protein
LLLFSLSLGLDLTLVFGAAFATAASVFVGLGMTAIALAVWFGAALALRTPHAKEAQMNAKPRHEPVDTPTKIEQMLTEARVILPGAQALFGFQLIVMLTETFGALPDEAKLVHAASLLCVALTAILLMAPAALHRLSFAGEDSPTLLRIGAHLVTAALLPLSLGLAGDVYVAIGHSLGNEPLGLASAALILSLLLALWYAWPLAIRARLAQK